MLQNYILYKSDISFMAILDLNLSWFEPYIYFQNTDHRLGNITQQNIPCKLFDKLVRVACSNDGIF